MRRYLVILVLLCVLAVPVLAMIIEEPTIEEKITLKETIKPIDTILPEETILPNETPLPIIPNRELFLKAPIQYNEKTTLLKKITMIFDGLIGVSPVEDTEIAIVDVVLDNRVVATIPSNSKFTGIEPHKYCLKYQYGTTNWYNCEQGLL